MSKYDLIITKVSDYYSSRVKTFGANYKGLDWNSQESQEIRFSQLLKICEHDSEFTVLDFGCGYGYMGEYMEKKGFKFSKYIGFDISQAMIHEAIMKYSHHEKFKFFNQISNLTKSDYCIASGIFNVKMDYNENEWEEYVLDTLSKFNQYSSKGFSFNILTSYSDINLKKDYLYYADPCFYFDYCKRHYSKNVSLLHDYGLYEFTILVRKGEFNQ